MGMLKCGLPQGCGFRLFELDSLQTYPPPASCYYALGFVGKFGTFVGVVLSESSVCAATWGRG